MVDALIATDIELFIKFVHMTAEDTNLALKNLGKSSAVGKRRSIQECTSAESGVRYPVTAKYSKLYSII